MNEFLNDIQTKFGTSGVVIAEMWVNFYMFSHEAEDIPSYINFVKTQMAILINHFNIDAKTFNKIVKTSELFLEKADQTIH
jgi:hypothetical protein